VACTACIDACDDVMDRLGRPRGLIRYDSHEGLQGRPRRILRPRVFFYSVLMVIGAVVAFVATRHHTDFEVNLLRLQGEPYTLVGDEVRDSLSLHIVNKVATPRAFQIEVEPVDGMGVVLPTPTVSLGPMGDARVPVFLSMPRARFLGHLEVHVTVRRGDQASDAIRVVGSFLGPG
jgi:polyferredoxin